MSDYLSRLIARSLDAAEVIQPRLPGQFEPISYQQFAERSMTFFEEIVESRSNMIKPEHVDRPAAPYPDQSIKGHHDHEHRVSEYQVSEPRVQRQDRRILEDLHVSGDLHTLEDRPNTEDRNSPENGPASEEVQEKADCGAEDEAPIRPDTKYPVHLQERSFDVPAAPSRNEITVEKAGGLVTPGNIERYIRPTAFGAVPEHTHPGQLLNAETTAFFIEPLSPAHAQKIPIHKSVPTIKVNIGRVEVKADVQPPQPRKRSAQTPPKLSLEDYLRQRSGGRA
jgi:hypothetical protein